MTETLIEEETRKRNRHQSRAAERTHFWCQCDRNHVTVYGKDRKCSLCGYRGDKEGKRKFK